MRAHVTHLHTRWKSYQHVNLLHRPQMHVHKSARARIPKRKSEDVHLLNSMSSRKQVLVHMKVTVTVPVAPVRVFSRMQKRIEQPRPSRPPQPQRTHRCQHHRHPQTAAHSHLRVNRNNNNNNSTTDNLNPDRHEVHRALSRRTSMCTKVAIMYGVMRRMY